MASQARIAGTVKIDGLVASRDVVVIKDDPAGREVVAVGQSASDGTFDISYSGWTGSVIALAIDEYGQEFKTSKALNQGVIVHPATPNGYVYEVTVAGTTAAEEPVWSTTGTVQSGGVTFSPRAYYRPVASGPLLPEVISYGNSATGGVETTIDIEGVDYRVHTFSESGDLVVSGELEVEYVLVAGGGGGGSENCGGGGGGGGVLIGTATLAEGTYAVNVGEGGQNPVNTGNLLYQGVSGQDTTAFGLVATGGGGGGMGGGGNNLDEFGADGGSGGGGAGTFNSSNRSGGTGVDGQGNDGGTGLNTPDTNSRSGGGGGGASEAGSAATAFVGGKGGDGISTTIRGAVEHFGGGGGGATNSSTPGEGGQGGGGRGGYSRFSANLPEPGAPNTGGGGGGLHESNPSASVGSGGSGVVIIRYVVA